MFSQHPNDIPGHLTRQEVWSRVSLALLLGVSLAIAKSSGRKRSLGEASCPPFTFDQARRAVKKVRGADRFPIRTIRVGMNVEREHADIGSCHSPTKALRIAMAHLRERPDYYERLRRYVEGLSGAFGSSKCSSLLDLIERARSQGWTVERTKSSHWKFVPPDKTKKIVIVSGTPSDPRSRKNDMALLKRSGLQGLGSARRGWDAARAKQQRYTTKTYKPGPFDHWTDEELWEKARSLIVGRSGEYDEGAWYDLDRSYTIGNWGRRDAQTCYAQDQHIRRAVSNINLAKRIYDTGRLTKFSSEDHLIDFSMLAERVKEAIRAHDASCPSPYNGPTFP